MKNFKEFCIEHKKEIVITAAIIFAYRLGFNRGYETADNAMKSLIKEAYNTIHIRNFQEVAYERKP